MHSIIIIIVVIIIILFYFFSVVEAKFNSIWIPQFFRFFHLLLFPVVMTFTFTSWSESSSTSEGRRTGTHARMLQSLPPLYTSYIQHKQQGQ